MRWFTKDTTPQTVLLPSDYLSQVHIDLSRYPSIQKQLHLLELTKEDLAILKQLQPQIQQAIPVMVDRFYEGVSANSELASIINTYSQIERLKITLHRHISGIFEGNIDDAYIKDRQRIASTHVRIGLQSKWYLGSFQSLITTFINLLTSMNLSHEDAKKAIAAFTKIINLEQIGRASCRERV